MDDTGRAAALRRPSARCDDSGMFRLTRGELGCFGVLMGVVGIVAGCEAVIPDAPDLAAIVTSRQAGAARARAVPAIDAEFERIEREVGPALATSLSDGCHTRDEGFILPAYDSTRCVRTVIHYYGADGKSCADMLRMLQSRGWSPLPRSCQAWAAEKFPWSSRSVRGRSEYAGLDIRFSLHPLAPTGRQEERFTRPHRPGGAELELRGVDIADLSTWILREHSHVMAISIDVQYLQVPHDDGGPWGPI
ncbi:hypothetical protein [Actinomadura sp. NPDC000600]|uniref:hypothetical protein n=1 Tax=Actinomadura sp. NPDC000600 TaxID=3154262 RepID=UPI0033966DCC